MLRFTAHYEDLGVLRTQWERNLQFGVLVAELTPDPAEGDRADITLSLDWLGATVLLQGEVIEVQGPHSVTEVDPLTSATVGALVAAGLEEAGGAPVDVASAAPPAVAPVSAASAPPAAGASPVPSGPPPVPSGPPPVPSGPAATPRPPRPSTFSPQGITTGGPSGGVAPGSQAPLSQAPLSQTVPSFPSESLGEPALEPTGDPNDLATIAAAGGPATGSAEALLPPPTQHGDFAKISWREVLLHFYSHRATGVLVIEGFRESRWCYLVEGRPVHFLGDIPHPGEFLSDVLVGDEVVSLVRWGEALRAQQVTGIPAGEYLVMTGCLDREALNQALSRRTQRITRKLMGMNFGRFRFHPYRELAGLFPFTPVPVVDLVLQEQRAHYEAASKEEIVSQASSLYSLHCRLVLSRLDLLNELPLTPEELRLVKDVLPSNWVLAELVALDEMRERDLLCFLLSLKGLGLVEFVRDEGEGKDRNRAEREIYSTINRMVGGTEFDALGVHWSSSSEDIERGHQTLLERFSEAHYGRLVDSRIVELIGTLERTADEAMKKVIEPVDRRKVRRTLVGADQIRMAAELLQGHAKDARAKGEFGLAKACCLRVVDLNPEGSEGREMLARARKWLSESTVARAGFPSTEAMVAIRQDLGRLN